MGKQKNYGSYSLREWSGLFANPLASKLADVFSKTPPSRQAERVPCFFWMPILGTFLISSKARKAGPLAERVGDVVSQSRASWLVKGFENATPARNSGRRPASLLHPCSSESSVVPHAFFSVCRIHSVRLRDSSKLSGIAGSQAIFSTWR